MNGTDCGRFTDALERTKDLNAQIGITTLDAESISQAFRDYEEKAEEIEGDYFGGSPYD